MKLLLKAIISILLFSLSLEAAAAQNSRKSQKSPSIQALKRLAPENKQIIEHLELAQEVESINRKRFRPQNMLEVYGSGYQHDFNQAQSPFGSFH